MKFTDDDLKRLKEKLDNPGLLPDERDEFLEGLIARLEAAEKVCDYVEKVYDPHAAICLKAWHKAAGHE